MSEDTLLSLVGSENYFERRKTALVFWDGEEPLNYLNKISYGSLRDKISKFASFLRSLGIVAGERVALMLPNSPQFVIAYFGILKMGAVAVPINPLYESDPKTLSAVLKDSGARAVVAWDIFLDILANIKDETCLKKIIHTGPADALPWGKAKVYNWRSNKSGKFNRSPAVNGNVVNFFLYESCGMQNHEINIKPADHAVILYTSGTSGEPKGALHTHASLLSNARSCEKLVIELGMKKGEEVFLAAAPFFHIMGLCAMLHLPLLMRGKIILLPKPGEIGKLLDAIDNTRPTGFVGFPKLYDAMNSKLKKDGSAHDLSALKVCISGAARLSVDTKKRFKEFWSGEILTGYGSTETGITHCQRTAKEGGVGKKLDMVCDRISDDGENNTGELLVRTKSSMRGYWNKPKETNEVFGTDCWFHTGDMAIKTAEGDVQIFGRISDDFVKGSHGEKIPLGSAEKLLAEHPLVREAAVVAVPKENGKFFLKAFIVLRSEGSVFSKENYDDLFCTLKTLPSSQIPDEIVLIKEIPKSPMGKVLKKVLRASS